MVPMYPGKHCSFSKMLGRVRTYMAFTKSEKDEPDGRGLNHGRAREGGLDKPLTRQAFTMAAQGWSRLLQNKTRVHHSWNWTVLSGTPQCIRFKVPNSTKHRLRSTKQNQTLFKKYLPLKILRYNLFSYSKDFQVVFLILISLKNCYFGSSN